MANFNLVQKFGNDSGNIATGLNRAIGHPSHQSTASATIDKPQPVIGNQLAKGIGDIAIFRAVPVGGAGKNTDIFH